MKCNKCNYKNNESSKYCENCGKKLNNNIILVSILKLMISLLISLPFSFLNIKKEFFYSYILIYSFFDYFILYKRFKYNVITNIISIILFMLLSKIIIIFIYNGTEYDLLNILFIGPFICLCLFLINTVIDFIFYKIKKGR